MASFSTLELAVAGPGAAWPGRDSANCCIDIWGVRVEGTVKSFHCNG